MMCVLTLPQPRPWRGRTSASADAPLHAGVQLAQRAAPAQPPPAHAPSDLGAAEGGAAAAPQRRRSADLPPAPRLVLPPRPTNLRGLSASPKRKRKAAAAGAAPHEAHAGAVAGLEEGAMGSDTPPGPPAARIARHRDAPPSPSGPHAEGYSEGVANVWPPIGLPHVATAGPGAGAGAGMASPHPHPSSRGSSDSIASPWARALDAGYELSASPTRVPALPQSAFAAAAAAPLERRASGRLSAAASLDLGSALRERPNPDAGLGSDAERTGGAPPPPARRSQGSAPAAERSALRAEGGRASTERAPSVTTSAKSMCAAYSILCQLRLGVPTRTLCQALHATRLVSGHVPA